jgi:hypothetical protein
MAPAIVLPPLYIAVLAGISVRGHNYRRQFNNTQG